MAGSHVQWFSIQGVLIPELSLPRGFSCNVLITTIAKTPPTTIDHRTTKTQIVWKQDRANTTRAQSNHHNQRLDETTTETNHHDEATIAYSSVV